MSLQKICTTPSNPVDYPFQVPYRGYGNIAGIEINPPTALERIKSPPATKRAKSGTFKTAEFFKDGKNTFQKSYLEIAKAQGIQELTAKLRIKTDVENGYISKERTTYKSQKYKALLDGRNKYHVTEKGREELNISRSIPQSIYNSFKEEFGKSKALENSSFKIQQERQKLLQKHDLSNLVGKAPDWWFKDSKHLEKTLKLLKQKQAKGYKVQNPLRWLSSVLKQEAVGYGVSCPTPNKVKFK
jgi:DNA-binding Lrp family transcriptional regulator